MMQPDNPSKEKSNNAPAQNMKLGCLEHINKKSCMTKIVATISLVQSVIPNQQDS